MTSLKKGLKAYIAAMSACRGIYLLGDGRSGTTWLSEILNFSHAYLDIFEPFHGRHGLDLPEGRLYPRISDIPLLKQGATLHLSKFAVRYCVQPRNLSRFPTAGWLAKDISSQLLIDRIDFGRMSVIWLVRHPFSVALSKANYGTWHRPEDIPCLYSDGGEWGDPLRKHFQDGDLREPLLEFLALNCFLTRLTEEKLRKIDHLKVHYEDLVDHRESEIERVFEFLGKSALFSKSRGQILEASRIRSRTSSGGPPSALSPEERWIQHCSPEIRKTSFQILENFGML